MTRTPKETRPESEEYLCRLDRAGSNLELFALSPLQGNHALRQRIERLTCKADLFLVEALQIAQAVLRHSDPSLTANVCTDPRLLDVAAAMDALPSLPLDSQQPERQRATGTLDDRPLAPTLTPSRCKPGRSGQEQTSRAGSTGGRGTKRGDA